MPITYSLVPEDRLVLTVWRGPVTLKDWEDHLTAMLGDPDFNATRNHLVDIRSAQIDPGLGQSEIQAIVDYLMPHRARIEGRKAAVLAAHEMPKSDLVADLVRQLGLRLITFIFLDPALDWLGLEAAGIEDHLRDLREKLEPPA